MTDVSLQPILALLGCPVAGNPTQYMMEKALAQHGLDWRYLSLEVSPEDLGDAVRGMRAMGFAGGNCADPHKETIGQHLARLGPTAEMAGVVNLLLREEGELAGENTEGKAVLETVRRRADPAGRRVVLLGSGKLARAVAVEMALAGADHVTVVGRNEEAGRGLAALVADRLEVAAEFVPWQGDYALAPETDVLIHATSIGQSDPLARVPLVPGPLAAPLIVVDTVLTPPDTRLVAQAAAQGCKTVDGLEVFLTQAAIDFRLWTGVEPDVDVLREAVEEFLEL